MAKVLVTGGAGFIGSHIVDALVEGGNNVTVIDDLSSGSKTNLSPSVEFLQLDVRSGAARDLLTKLSPDTVVHTAAQISVRESMRDPSFDVDVNVKGIVNLLQGCRDGKKPHFIFLSTGGAIYGEQERFPADENHPVKPTSIYGLSKRVSEMYLEFWQREFRLPFTALRLGNIYGPRQNPHGEAGVVAIFCEKLLKGETPVINGTGKQTRDFVYVKDVASAARTVLERGITGIYNIGTARETDVNTLYAHLCRALNKDVKPQYGPAKEGEQMRSVITAALAKRSFGWEPRVTVEEGLRLTAEWFASSR